MARSTACRRGSRHAAYLGAFLFGVGLTLILRLKLRLGDHMTLKFDPGPLDDAAKRAVIRDAESFMAPGEDPKALLVNAVLDHFTNEFAAEIQVKLAEAQAMADMLGDTVDVAAVLAPWPPSSAFAFDPGAGAYGIAKAARVTRVQGAHRCEPRQMARQGRHRRRRHRGNRPACRRGAERGGLLGCRHGRRAGSGCRTAGLGRGPRPCFRQRQPRRHGRVARRSRPTWATCWVATRPPRPLRPRPFRRPAACRAPAAQRGLSDAPPAESASAGRCPVRQGADAQG